MNFEERYNLCLRFNENKVRKKKRKERERERERDIKACKKEFNFEKHRYPRNELFKVSFEAHAIGSKASLFHSIVEICNVVKRYMCKEWILGFYFLRVI